jgi:hypothetical protein
LANAVQEQEVLRAGQDELARSVYPIHDSLNVRKQVRHALDLVQNDPPPELIQEPAGVLGGERAGIRVFKRRVAVPGKDRPHKRGLARLARSRDGNDRVVSGRPFQRFGEMPCDHRCLV